MVISGMVYFCFTHINPCFFMSQQPGAVVFVAKLSRGQEQPKGAQP